MKQGEIWKRDFAGKIAPATDLSGAKNGCAPAGTSAANASSTATTRRATLEQVLSPRRNAASSRPTSQRSVGRTRLPLLRPDFPGRGLVMPGLRKSHMTNPSTPAGSQLHVIHQSSHPIYPSLTPRTPTTTTSLYVRGTTATSQLP